ncbi:MAG: hypothetical protein WCR51_06225 [Planctomycetia bacterium]
MKLKAVVISWEGTEERARAIAMHLREHMDQVSLTYSTGGADLVIPGVAAARVPSEWYFGRKFGHALSTWGDEAMLLVQADTDSTNWHQVVAGCARALSTPPVKMWSPEIDVTAWPTELVQLPFSSTSNLRVVAQTDGVVLGLGADVVQRLKQLDYQHNNLGWGIDWVALCHTYANNGVAVRDRSVSVHHATGRGYQPQDAAKQMAAFLRQMTLTEHLHYEFLQLAIQDRRNQLRTTRETGQPVVDGRRQTPSGSVV